MLTRIVVALSLAICASAVAVVLPAPQGEAVRVQSRIEHMAAVAADDEAITLARALVQLASETCAVAPPPPARASAPVKPQGRHDI